MKKHLFTLLLLAVPTFTLCRWEDYTERCAISEAQQELLDGLMESSLVKIQHALEAGATAGKSPAILACVTARPRALLARRMGPLTYAVLHKLNDIAQALAPSASAYDLLEATYAACALNSCLVPFLNGCMLGRGINPSSLAAALTPPAFPEEFASERETGKFTVWKLKTPPHNY